MSGADITVATVASANPLELVIDTSSTRIPARLLDGTSFTPAAGARVIVLRLGRVIYVLGGA